MRELEISFDHRGSAETLYGRLTDPVFLKAQALAVGALKAEVIESGIAAAGPRTVVRQSVEADVPRALSRVLPSTIETTEYNEWSADGAGTYRSTWKVDLSGVPVSLKGRTTISAVNSGSTFRLTVEVKASVPLIGGKIESLIVENINRDAQLRDDYLRAHASS